MKYIGIICIYICSTSALFAQLYTTATQVQKSKYQYVTYADLFGEHLLIQHNIRGKFTTSSDPIPTSYATSAWNGNIQNIGAALPSVTPTIRRAAQGFPTKESGEPGVKAASMVDVPWLLIIVCANGYFLRKKQKLCI